MFSETGENFRRMFSDGVARSDAVALVSEHDRTPVTFPDRPPEQAAIAGVAMALARASAAATAAIAQGCLAKIRAITS